MRTPQSLLYSSKHLWTKMLENGIWEAGITDYAQDLLGDVVFIDAPAVGSKLSANQPCGLIESVKTGSDLHALVDGEVVEINQELISSPEQVNDDPYKAWIFRYRPESSEVEENLLSADDYQSIIASL